MGSNKALISYQGKPLIQYSVDLARLFTNAILLSANNDDFDYLGFPVVKDTFAVKAPLAGIHAGLTSSLTDWNLILTCDMPNVTRVLVDRLLSALDDNSQIVIPIHGRFVEPLCGFYHRGLIQLIESNMTAGKLSLLDLPGSAPHKFIPADDIPYGVFRNMNEKKDLLT